MTPFADDDSTNPWCKHVNTTIGEALIPWECSELKCIVERDMDTGDADNDLIFTPTPTAADYMVIQPGRAKLYINKTLQNHAFAMSNDWEETEVRIEVPSGASFLYSAAISTTALAFASLAF